MAEGLKGFSDDTPHNECTPECLYQKMDVATDITGRLNSHIDEPQTGHRKTFGEA